MKRSKYIISILIALCFIMAFFVSGNFYQVANAQHVSTSASSMILIEKKSKRIIMEKNKDTQLPMASTTKIMTALSVLKRCENLDTEIKIDKRAVGVEGTSMYLRQGEVLSIKDLLTGMIIPSGNDAAVALALHFSKTTQDFASIMNADAKALGAYNTNFVNPHGLDEAGHYTTAYDLALITAKAFEYPFFAELVKTKSASVKGAGGDQGDIRILTNKNRLLGHYKECTGVKIGFTDNAGRCLVSSAEKDGLELICVVLNCPDMFMDSKRILEYGFENYIYSELLEPYKVHRKIVVEDGKESEVKVYSKKGFSYPLTLDETMEITFGYKIPTSIQAPVQKEQVVGKYMVYLKGNLIFEEDLFALEAVKSTQIKENLKDIASGW